MVRGEGPQAATVGVLAVIADGDRVLLVRTSYGDGRWQLPGGFIDNAETPEEALARELREELRLEISVGVLRGVYYKAYERNLNLVFDATIKAGIPAPDGDEIVASGYFAKDAPPSGLSARSAKVIAAVSVSPRVVL